MTTRERIDVRKAIKEVGFVRDYFAHDPKHYDLASIGVYTEEWRSKKDRTKIIIEWDVKSQ